MRRVLSLLIVGTVWGTVLAAPPESRAVSPADFERTAAYAASLQNPDGGFAAQAGAPSTLGATNAGLRTLLHVGGSVPDVLACVRFIQSCQTAEGGFADRPGGKADSHTTSIGLLAGSTLKALDPKRIDDAIAYLGKTSKTFEEVRLAAAALEATGHGSPEAKRWYDQIQAMRNPDGTFGEGAARVFATGGSAAAILRLKQPLEHRDLIAKTIKEGQRPEGGWSKNDGPPDLSSTYRVFRALFMMGERPDLEKLMGFVARCRKADGSYSATPEGPGSLGGTYLGTIAIQWIRMMRGLPSVVETAGFTPLVHGDSLKGWEGDTQLWSARNGTLIGRSSGLDHNDFLANTRPYGDFILSLNFRMRDGKGNSGVQFRSVRVPPHEMSGYQADLGDGYWGSLYDESRRNRTLVQPRPESLKTLHRSDWNHYVVRAMGDRITLTLNGRPTVPLYREEDPKVAREGLIAVQMHAGGPMEIEFRDMMIQPMPTPSASGDPNRPGFHLRTLKSDQGDRKYSVYVPEGYDGTKTFPVVLFLHGAGERGDDGVRPAQVGIGPAILKRPGGIPALVVFPQARETWRAGSPDSDAALQALEEVLKNYKADPKHLVLTGLSMGGHGSWDLAAAHPERFSAVVPICGGPSKSVTAATLKGVPVWTFCGDADRAQTIHGLRDMVAGIRGEGGQAHHTEYRGVGHNSWDRAYNDPKLIEWMLAAH